MVKERDLTEKKRYAFTVLERAEKKWNTYEQEAWTFLRFATEFIFGFEYIVEIKYSMLKNVMFK